MIRNLASLVLTFALVVVFAYFGVDKFVHPLLWVGFLPAWMDGLLGMDTNIWIKIIGGAEIIMALLIVIPSRIARMTGSALIVLHFLGILSQVGINNDICIRDIGLMLSSVALFLFLWEQGKNAGKKV